MACGGIKSGQDMQMLLDMNLVAVMGKTAICYPDFPKKVQEDSSFVRPVDPPLTLEYLALVDVSPPFVEFLKGMRMVKIES